MYSSVAFSNIPALCINADLKNFCNQVGLNTGAILIIHGGNKVVSENAEHIQLLRHLALKGDVAVWQ